jgi:hypothetical protein
MKKTLMILPLSIMTYMTGMAQIGGQYIYAFLKQSPSARLTALNNSQIALRDDDLTLAYINPAHLNESMHNHLSFNQNILLAKISSGFVGYGYHISPWKTTFQAGMQYISYGNFKQTDEFGNQIGTFKASEYALSLSAGRAINERFSAGLSLKFLSSQLEAYTSLGLVADLAGAYWQPEKQMGVTVVFRNIGAQLTTYNNNREDMPLDIQVGFTKKLKKAPFRFSVALHDLNRWDLRYDSPFDNAFNNFNEVPSEPSKLSVALDNFFRHANFGGEILFGKTEPFRLRIGYSHQVRKELNVNEIRSFAGFSFGLGIKVNRFRIDYGFGKQHPAGGKNHFSISTHFGEFKKS